MKVLFCPLATHGFVFPAIAVASALRDRGHTVGFVTGPAFGDLLATQGLQRIQRGKNDGLSFPMEAWFEPLSIAMQVKHIEYALQTFGPDVLIAHPMSLGALIVAERERLPLAVLGLSTHIWPVRNKVGSSTEIEERLAWRHADMMRYFNDARRLFKLELCQAGPLESPFLGDLFMLQSVPELIPDIAEYPERVHLVGSCLWEPLAMPDREFEQWLAEIKKAHAPLIYVHHGRSFRSPTFWSQVVDALGDGPYHVAAAVGRMDRPVSGGGPANFFVRDHLCQSAALSRARMVISGGNTTAVLGALTHGLPSVLLPGGGEQADVALQVDRAGAGRILPLHGITAAMLRKAVDDVLSDVELTVHVRNLQRAFERAGGAQYAAHLIERLGDSGGPVLRAATMPQSVDVGG